MEMGTELFPELVSWRKKVRVLDASASGPLLSQGQDEGQAPLTQSEFRAPLELTEHLGQVDEGHRPTRGMGETQGVHLTDPGLQGDVVASHHPIGDEAEQLIGRPWFFALRRWG
jgi:hypothetical protein